MAGEEEAELRDLVAQSLEAKGVLGKIRVSFARQASQPGVPWPSPRRREAPFSPLSPSLSPHHRPS